MTKKVQLEQKAPEQVDNIVEEIKLRSNPDQESGNSTSEHFVENCDFCNEFLGSDNKFSKIYKGILHDRIILKTSNFAYPANYWSNH